MTVALQHNDGCWRAPATSSDPDFGFQFSNVRALFRTRLRVHVMSADPFQVQFHPKLGVVIYDPVAQMGISKEQLRLFKLESMTATTFVRAIVSKDLTACPQAEGVANASGVDSYRAARGGRRKPYCEHCRRHFGSVDFAVCKDCNAIRCTCGTCSCASGARRRKAA